MQSVIDFTQKNNLKSNLKNADNLINTLESLKAGNGSVDSTKGAIDKLNKTTMDNYKIIKKIEKGLNAQQESTLDTTHFGNDVNLNKAIAAYLLRLGWRDLFDEYCASYGIKFDELYIRQNMFLNNIIKDLKQGNLDTAIFWCSLHQKTLHALNSPLLFYLHRSKFLQAPNSLESLTYFKENISPYLSIKQFAQQASSLLASLAFKDLSTSPYSYLATEAIHSQLLVPCFEEYYCILVHIPKIDHLKLTVDIGGGSALPILSRFNQMIHKTRTEWTQSDELPVEIPLDDRYRFHSVFTCPISKEQTTEANPPMMLSCGHVLANDSLTKLSKGGGRVKCPYCPTESQSSAALRVYF